jgi:hypothetical protein
MALLAFLTLGGVSAIGASRFGVPTAHAASGCTNQGWYDEADIPNLSTNTGPPVQGTTANMLGDAHADAFYWKDSNGNFCGFSVDAWARLYLGSHWGYLWGGLYNCSGQLVAGTNVVHMNLGSPYTYNSIDTSPVYLTCGFVAVEAWSYPSPGNKAYMQSTSDVFHW